MDLLSFVVAILPVFLIGWYIYKKDKVKESSKLLFKLFMFGVLSCIPAAFIGSLLGVFFPEMENMTFLQLFLYVFIVVALVEEFCKWFFMYKETYNHVEFDSTYDMIVYAVFTALGFACFENILYVQEYGIITGILRALLAVPGHACDGILMGVYLGIAKIKSINGDNNAANKYKILSIIVPTITHGIYDFCLFWGSVPFVVTFLFFVVILDIICIKKVKSISKNNFKFNYKNKFCTGCGLPVFGNYCPKCGKKQELH